MEYPRIARLLFAAVAALPVIGLAAGPANAAADARADRPVTRQVPTYYEVLHNNMFRLILTARNFTSGSSVGLATDNDTSHQRWRDDFTGVNAEGQETYRYVLRASENTSQPQCLDVKGKSKSDGADIVILPCDGSSSQRWAWRLDFQNAGYAAMQNDNSKKFMDVPTGPIFVVNLKQFTSPVSHEDWSFRHVKNV
jgi:hypothetical protein